MSLTSSESELLAQFQLLPPASQQKALMYLRSLRTKEIRGIPGHKLLKLAGRLSPEAAAEMTAAIEEGCEQINESDW